MIILDSYSFGRLTVNGEVFTKDFILLPDGRIHCPWWRKQGHRLEIVDIEELIDTLPDIIVVGTGYTGLMKPAGDLTRHLAENSIEFIVQRTGRAVQTYNEISGTKKVGSCFHLTC